MNEVLLFEIICYLFDRSFASASVNSALATNISDLSFLHERQKESRRLESASGRCFLTERSAYNILVSGLFLDRPTVVLSFSFSSEGQTTSLRCVPAGWYDIYSITHT